MSRKSKAERRQEILACARDAFAESGYHRVTIDEITQRIGIARGTFYLYFEDKRAILGALLEEVFERVDRNIHDIELEGNRDSPLAQLRSNLLRVATLALEEPAMMKILLHNAPGLDPEFDTKLRLFFAALDHLMDGSLEQGQHWGFVRQGDRRFMLAMGLGGIKELILRCVNGELETSAEALSEEILGFLRQGVLTAELR